MGKIFLFLGVFLLIGCQSNSKGVIAAYKKPEIVDGMARPFLTNIKPLVLEGVRSGEGYFSRDGQWMVFQSEREEKNPFYQIYLMNLKSRETKRVSNGRGKTTCAWIHPDSKRVLFSSTHLDPQFDEKVKAELAARKNPVKQKYEWSFDDQFDIFEASADGRSLKRLTQAKGYDAEGSYSPDGKWIVFASNRPAYEGSMSESEKELFEKDPSSQMEIYLMKADGTQVKRLTNHLGYDGGPFFSPDGQKIVWRRFNQQGTVAEIYTMNIDGTEEKALTRLNAMSWAPFYHPSGDYIIFTSNKLGYSNFEIFIVDKNGSRTPVRVSFLDGFDGLPVFTPDGQKLVWTHTNENGESQLHMADWNDGMARRALGLPPARPQIQWLSQDIRESDVRLWVSSLASREMEGRMTGGPQEKIYTDFISRALQDMGYQPLEGKEFIQTFDFTSGIELGPQNAAELWRDEKSSTPLVSGRDWLPLSLSQIGTVEPSALVFAGYGIVAPAIQKQEAYDSYKDLDVKGKWVVVFRGLPDGVSNERRFHLNLYAKLQHKAMMARERGAAGLIVVNDSVTPSKPLKLTFEGRADNSGLPVLEWNQELADKVFGQAQTTRKEWSEKLAQGETGSFEFPGLKLSAKIDLVLKKAQGRNVLGLLKVPGATKTLMIGAHSDHLGRGEGGNSLARADEFHAIHYGADDNASGVAAVLEVAHQLASGIKSGAVKPKYNLAIGIWSGEEIGTLGSSHFAKNNKKTPLVAYLNLDMVGRLRNDLMVQGAASAHEWRGWLERSLAQTSLNLSIQNDPYLPTDSMAFYLQQTPTLTFFTGSHSEYHTPRDTADTLNYPGIVQVAELVRTFARDLLTNPSRGLTYKNVQGSGSMGGDRSFRLYLGTIPDYAAEGKKGLLISGTSKDSPADKAGLKPGDLIVELGGVQIKNIYDYVYCLQSMKANEKTPLKVMRENKVVELEIVPQLKTER